MAPGRPVRDIVVKVPRHNADILRKDLAQKVQAAAKDERINVQLEQPLSEEVARAVESASEWNSLLMTARAERGPQWDIGTQQFHVDMYSDLYYDPTSLLASTRQALGVEDGEGRTTSPQDTASSPSVRRSHRSRGASQAPLPPAAASATRREMDMLAARGGGMSPPRDMGMGLGGMGGPPPGMRPDMGDTGMGGMRGFPAGMTPAAMRAGMGMGMGGPGGLPNSAMGMNGMAGMGNMGMGMNNMGRMGGMPPNMAGNLVGGAGPGMGMGGMGMGSMPPGAGSRRMM